MPSNSSVNPTCSIENDDKDFTLASFFLSKTLQMSKLKFSVSRAKFSRTAQIFLEFANIEHNWKIEKFFSKTIEKLLRFLSGKFEKLARL